MRGRQQRHGFALCGGGRRLTLDETAGTKNSAGATSFSAVMRQQEAGGGRVPARQSAPAAAADIRP